MVPDCQVVFPDSQILYRTSFIKFLSFEVNGHWKETDGQDPCHSLESGKKAGEVFQMDFETSWSIVYSKEGAIC